jgi:hypothetical protein
MLRRWGWSKLGRGRRCWHFSASWDGSSKDMTMMPVASSSVGRLNSSSGRCLEVTKNCDFFIACSIGEVHAGNEAAGYAALV